MAASAQTDQSRFSMKSFCIGLCAVALIYAILFGIALSNSDETQEALQNKLASMTVLVDNKGQLNFQIQSENSDHTDTDNTNAPDTTKDPQTDPESTKELNLEDLVSQQSKALREAPVEGFYEETAAGRLPIAKSTTQTPFLIYSKPYVLNKNKPYISIVINDFGLSESLSQEMIETLPSSVTFILSPYSTKPNEWIAKARADGHEVWLNLPIENKNFPLSDPGTKGLLTRVSLQYNQDRLEWILSRADGYTGIAAYTDDALKNAGNVFDKMVRNIFGRGIGFLEMNTENDSFFLPIAQKLNTPRAHSTAAIDVLNEDNASVKAVYAAINRDGHAVAVVSPSPVNIGALENWMQSMDQDGIASVPLSAVAAPDTERN